MLAQQYRLRRPYEIARVYKQGKFGAAEGLSIKAARNSRPHNRLAIVVSKKVDKRAVVRNRLRRRASGAVEQLWIGLPAGYDIVVTIREDNSARPAEALRQDIKRALDRALK